MPQFPNPLRSSTDRIASFALYRALLSQASALTSISSQQRSEIQNLIRKRFRRARGILNPDKRRLYFSAGYEALDYLDAAAAGSHSHTSAILSLLARAPAHAKTARPPPPQRASLSLQKKEKTPSILDRPLPLSALSGPRHVPVLFNAAQIPVLRLKKPQPERLTSYIVGRLRQRQNRHNRRQRLLEDKLVAESEDAWDEILRAHLEEKGDSASSDDHAVGRRRREGRVSEEEEQGREESWVAEVDLAIENVVGLLEREKERNGVMAVRLQEVVDRERELWEVESAAAAG